jgi:hypothetical protein
MKHIFGCSLTLWFEMTDKNIVEMTDKVELHLQAKVMKMNKDILIFFQFIVIDDILILLGLYTFVLRWAEVTFTDARTFTSLFAHAYKNLAAAVTSQVGQNL